MISVAIRLPPLWMSLNGRKHFREIAPIKEALIQDAKFAAERSPGLGALAAYSVLNPANRYYRVQWVFVVPDKIRRDTSNMLAACKYMEDGLALALGCDDSRFVLDSAYVVTLPGRRYAVARIWPESQAVPPEIVAEIAALGLPPNINALTKALDGWGRKKPMKVTRGNTSLRPRTGPTGGKKGR